MKLRLRTKALLLLILVSVFGYLLILLWATPLIQRQVRNSLVNDLYKDASYLASSYRANTGSVNRSQLEAMAYSSGSDIWIMAINGRIEAYSGTSVPPESVQDFNPAKGIDGYYMIGDFYGAYTGSVLSVYVPLTQDITPQGYVLFHYPLSSVNASADRYALVAYLSLAFCLVILVFCFILADLNVIRRIHLVQKAAREYSNGNLRYPLNLNGHDEITDLAVTQEDLAKQIGSIAEDQHRFLANISHDFRSPLTSIRGYLVAFQDGTIPPELQGKYINVILKETDRLYSLSNGLLDMTQLEKGIILEKASFDINDLIREILPTFEGRVLEKDLRFKAVFEAPHVKVSADRARIQQVLYNLIDNAMKFSSTGSTVDLSTRLHGDKVFVSVKDYGCGIPKESLGKIWDRFYKADSSRGKDKKGTGLGLSIVREIIQAHRENIDVISTPDVGTEFIFTLPLSDN